MNYKIFFAYQSDINEAYGKQFIHSAIDQVIAKFRSENINIELEFGMRKTPGNPLLIEEMLRKSQDSDIVIVDMTYTSSKIWSDSKRINLLGNEVRFLGKIKDKKSPNPNVLLETGYAWAQKGFYRTILLINNAFGTSDELPVDLKGFRWGIEYFLNISNYSQNKSVRKGLADDLYNAIKTAINSEAEYQRKKWQPMRLHKYWTPKDYRNIYRPTARIKEIIGQLRIDLENTNFPQRIVGPKNSGKTRLAYELYKEIDDTLPKHNHIEKVLYYDLGVGDYNRVEDKLQDLKLLNQRKIVILDNCPLKIHNKVFNEYFYDTSISLLTINNTDDGEGATQYVDTDFANEIIETLSNLTGNPRNTSFIIQNSNGNLRNAIVMIGRIPEGEEGFSPDYHEKWKQILGLDLSDPKVLKILEELSLFTHVGFYDIFQQQSDFISNQSGVESREKFEEIVFKLAERGIIKITGDFIILEVFVEELAFTRLERLANEDLVIFFKKITEIGLAKQLSNRLIELNKLKGTHQLIDILSMENGLLTKFNFVNSDQGARIIMSLAELEPEKILHSLEALFSNKSNEELLKLEDGRRNLVWALERLVFRNHTFKGAAKLLYRLSLAENENIGNNATSQFVQLFQLYLPGTQASLEDRIILLKELISEETGELKIIYAALDRALMVHGFTRMGGADEQAGEKLQDYQPKSNKEVLDYWQSAIDLLVNFENYDIIVSRFRGHIYNGHSDAILNALEELLKNKGFIDKNLRQQFENILNEQHNLPPYIIEKVKKMVVDYTKDTIREKFEFIVALAPYPTHKLEDGKLIKRYEEKIHELVKQLSESDNKDWYTDIDILLHDEQRLTFDFGKYISNLWQDHENLIITIINKLKDIPFEKQNNSFLEGYLYGIANQEFSRYVIDSFLQVNEIAYHALRMTSFLEFQLNDLEKLYPIVEANPKYAIALQYLKINLLPDDEFVVFINWLKKIDPFGIWVAIDLCKFNFGNEREISEKILHLFRSLIMHVGIFREGKSYNAFSIHHYIDLLKILEEKGLDIEMVEFLSNEIIESTKGLFFNHEYYFKNIIDILFTNYWEISWPIISKNMLQKDFYGWYNLKSLLKEYQSYNIDKLVDWMEKYPDEAPQYVIDFIPWVVREGGEETWSPLAKIMFDRYPGNEAFLSQLSSSLHSFSWSGSVVPLLESRKSLVEQLVIHPKKEIKEFAIKNVAYFNNEIKREKRNDENARLFY